MPAQFGPPRTGKPPQPPQPQVQQVLMNVEGEDDFCPCPACGCMFYNQVFRLALMPVPFSVTGEKTLGTNACVQCVECGECYPMEAMKFKTLKQQRQAEKSKEVLPQ